MEFLNILLKLMTLMSLKSIQSQAIRNFKKVNKFTGEQVLISELVETYDTGARPVYNSSHNITVKFSLSLIQIPDLVSIFLKIYFKIV